MRGPQTAGSWTTPAIIRGGSLSLEGALAAWASADRGAVVGMLVPAFELSKGLMGAAFSGGGGGGSLAVWLAVVAVVTGVGGCSGGGPHDGGDGEEDGGSATADAPPVPAGDGGRGGAGGAARDLLRRAACVFGGGRGGSVGGGRCRRCRTHPGGCEAAVARWGKIAANRGSPGGYNSQ